MSINPSTNGPSSTFQKQRGNNAVLSGTRPMPQKFYPSVGSSMFARAREVYSKDAGGGAGYHDSSSYIALKRNNAIGQSSMKHGLATSASLAFSDQGNKSSVRSTIRKMRSGGSVAPAKKGANTSFKSGGGGC